MAAAVVLEHPALLKCILPQLDMKTLLLSQRVNKLCTPIVSLMHMFTDIPVRRNGNPSSANRTRSSNSCFSSPSKTTKTSVLRLPRSSILSSLRLSTKTTTSTTAKMAGASRSIPLPRHRTPAAARCTSPNRRDNVTTKGCAGVGSSDFSLSLLACLLRRRSLAC